MSHSRLDFAVAAVAYADIFDYPLTRGEMRLWCIKTKISPGAKLPLPRHVEASGEYVFLEGRTRSTFQRKKRRQISKSKWRIARMVAKKLGYIPTIQLVGVTGGLAMDNARAKDDIDLFIITSAHTVWITRLLATLAVDAMGKRRKPGEVNVADRVCLNMFMGAEALGIAKKEQDLFAAHEVLQMVPLWERADAYRNFLGKNAWVEKFLPNAWKEKFQASRIEHRASNFGFGIWCLRFLERPAKFFQLWYMSRRRTSEVVGDAVLRFHPRDARIWVKEALLRRLDRLDIPLDKIFYAE